MYIIYINIYSGHTPTINGNLASIPLSINGQNMNLNDKTHFFWMSPFQFDLALDLFPDIINGNHSCGFGRTYNHLKERLPNEKNITRFHSYKSWLELYQGD